MSMPLRPKVCKVCRRALELHRESGVLSWRHHQQDALADHPVRPVDAESIEVKGRCDFCNGPEPTWVLPVRTFTAGMDDKGRAHVYEGDWGTCEPCAQLIDRNAWNRLLTRVQEEWEASHGVPAPESKKTGWRRLYRMVRENITGPVHPK